MLFLVQLHMKLSTRQKISVVKQNFSQLKYIFQVIQFAVQRAPRRSLLSLLKWSSNHFPLPAPQIVKYSVFSRYGLEALWIETGTYLGATTKYLSERYPLVHSIEPSVKYFEYAKNRFRNVQNVRLHLGTSESILPGLISKVLESQPNQINFWLDGHWSNADTFLGDQETPVMQELEEISRLIDAGIQVAVFIDDVRCFTGLISEYEAYPRLDSFVSWTSRNNLYWTIEHDIFIAKSTI